ncbi:MAG: hemerythrin family protein, partial [Azonexus sp.]|nr:hemerythrin family protein [Azonexus sp.]
MMDNGVQPEKPVSENRADGLLPLPADLPPELLTGHTKLDAEHRLLMASIVNLRQLCVKNLACADCGACPATQRQHCDSHLVAMLGDLLSFILEHFRIEEEIMRKSLMLMVDRDVCQAHMEDHALISHKVQEIVAALDPLRTVVLIRELDILLHRWVSNHIALHDMLLVRWLHRDDSVTRRNAKPA